MKEQVITRKINPVNMTGKYYQHVRNDLKRKIDHDTELLTINLIPTSTITEKYILESLFYLQRELTSIITISDNNVEMSEADFREFEIMFDCIIKRE